ncbi:flagellar basal body-associated FliL family protein [Sphingomonas cavernae]|uniref:Flagellar protein FliL n=1 Tax=Sphingomonas cavernae TaxID=2320861 RepID=A0A418WPR8_9SPHN|nr:flagellar basal body-associated FliL family protein [Sphingomonas cavernae]RJF93221.1 flagellar basal body protein FliL [Sphingomonas cavernae]
MSKDNAAAAPGKKGGMKKPLIIALGAIILVGGGAGGAIYASQSGLIGGAKPDDPYADKPKLVIRADGGREATYFEIEKSFTSNLADADGFMQLSLGVATYYDSRVLDNIKRHEVPIRSAVLMTLADQSVDVIATPEGKKQLQKALKDTVNRVLQEKEGFGGVDDVYFTSFVIQ